MKYTNVYLSMQTSVHVYHVYALIDPQIQLKKNKTRKFTCSQMPYVHSHWNKVWKCS